jgi:ribosomal-protein-alanine N-acetyltransferase
MSFFFKPMNVAYATQIVHWRYDAPYDVYNSVSDTSEIEKAIQSYLDPQNGYYCLS